MSRSLLLSWFYFILAIVGLLWSWSYFMEYFLSADNVSVQAFFALMMGNSVSSGVAIDAAVAGVVFSVIAVTNAASDGVKWPWLYVVITFSVGLCVSIPLYFGFRERVLANREF